MPRAVTVVYIPKLKNNTLAHHSSLIRIGSIFIPVYLVYLLKDDTVC